MGETLGDRLFRYSNIALMLLVLVIALFPYLNVLAVALNQGTDSMLGGLTVVPRKPTLENMRAILSDPGIWRALWVSVNSTILGTLLGLIVQFAAAYGIKRKDLGGRTAILTFLIIPMFFSGGLIPLYLLYSRTRLLNNFLVYVLPSAFSFYHMIVIRTYLQSAMPDELEEAAKIDGADDLTIFFRIVLPLSRPILATIGLWIAVGKWNDWTTTLYFVTRRSMDTLQYKMVLVIQESQYLVNRIQQAIEAGQSAEQLQQAITVTPQALVAAQLIVTTIPIILVYPFIQKYFVKGVMIGAVKG